MFDPTFHEVENASNHSVFHKSVFYLKVLDFHRPTKILCQTSGRQNHWSVLVMHVNYVGTQKLVGHHSQPACEPLVYGHHLGMDAGLSALLRLVRIPSLQGEPSRLSLYQCWRSVPVWSGSGSADPYLWLLDPDKSESFSSYNLPAGTLSSVLKI